MKLADADRNREWHGAARRPVIVQKLTTCEQNKIYTTHEQKTPVNLGRNPYRHVFRLMERG